jgi:EAL domain-containing protein (putative c-di-GMP-specific phosphodiesterase class I)
MAEIAMGDLVNYITQTLDEFRVPATCISVEMTESVIMKDLRLTKSVLTELHALGVTTALDDFGTGYSSLSYLRQLPLNCLKVDRSFTTELPDDPNSCSLTQAIIRMAEALKMGTIAEGVETREQMQWLLDQRCQVGQGYLFSRPVAAELVHAAVWGIEATDYCAGLEMPAVA